MDANIDIQERGEEVENYIDSNIKSYEVKLSDRVLGELYVSSETCGLSWNGKVNFSTLEEEVSNYLLKSTLRGDVSLKKQEIRDKTVVYLVLSSKELVICQLSDADQYIHYLELLKDSGNILFARYDVLIDMKTSFAEYSFTAENHNLITEYDSVLGIRMPMVQNWPDELVDWIVNHSNNFIHSEDKKEAAQAARNVALIINQILHTARLITNSQIRETILDTIGNTPLVRLHNIARGVRPALLAKVEFLNPGGSVKDRIGLAIIEAAEREGHLRPGGTIIEGTGGDTGISLAIAAAIKGYKTLFVMPDKSSDERIRLLRAFGARVVLTPTAVAPDDPRSYYSVSRRLAEETPNAFLAGQYWNPANPEAHYLSTGPELWRQTSGRISAFIAGIDTGGTISGVGRYLKERNPNIKVVGIDPVGSLYAHYFQTGELGEVHSYKLEGVGGDFLPSTMDFEVLDDVEQVTDRESFTMTRRLVREEGLFGGGSSGLAVAGALKWLRNNGASLGKDDVVVVLLPDSGSHYLSKVFDDTWMRENGFQAPNTVADLLDSRSRDVIIALEDTSIEAAIRQMKTHGISQMPVLDANSRLLGIIGEGDLLDYLLSGGALDHTIGSLPAHEAATVDTDMPLEELTNVFGRSPAVLVVRNGAVVGIVTKMDVIDFLANRQSAILSDVYAPAAPRMDAPPVPRIEQKPQDRSQNVQAVIAAKKRRLEKLEEQAAIMGSNVRPEVAVEIEDLRQEIGRLIG